MWELEGDKVVLRPGRGRVRGRLREGFVPDLARLLYRPDYVVEFLNTYLDRADLRFGRPWLAWDDPAFWRAAELAALWREFITGRRTPPVRRVRDPQFLADLGVPRDARAYVLAARREPDPDGRWVWVRDWWYWPTVLSRGPLRPRDVLVEVVARQLGELLGPHCPECGGPQVFVGTEAELEALFGNPELAGVLKELGGPHLRRDRLVAADAVVLGPEGGVRPARVRTDTAGFVRRWVEPDGRGGLRRVDVFSDPAACVAWQLAEELADQGRRACPVCGQTFSGGRRDRVYCSDRCRVKAQRLGLRMRLPRQAAPGGVTGG